MKFLSQRFTFFYNIFLHGSTAKATLLKVLNDGGISQLIYNKIFDAALSTLNMHFCTYNRNFV